jgi:hypothetical protein
MKLSLPLLAALLACGALRAVAAPAPDGAAEAKRKLEALKKKMPEVLKEWEKDIFSNEGLYPKNIRFTRERSLWDNEVKFTFHVYEVDKTEKPPKKTSVAVLFIFLKYHAGKWTTVRSEWFFADKNIKHIKELTGFLLDAIDEAAER